MRDSGNLGLTYWNMGPKDSGAGIVNLTSDSGRYVRCEFSYNLSSGSGLGLCKDQKSNAEYDFFMNL